jgi:prepilin-type N-terminal cleavage/methylation domain-containing protein
MKRALACNNLRHRAPLLRQRLTRAYTLVEIMIVVTIIGLIAVIALPNFLKHRNSVRVKSCIENLRVLYNAKAQWAFDTRQADSNGSQSVFARRPAS